VSETFMIIIGINSLSIQNMHVIVSYKMSYIVFEFGDSRENKLLEI